MFLKLSFRRQKLTAWTSNQRTNTYFQFAFACVHVCVYLKQVFILYLTRLFWNIFVEITAYNQIKLLQPTVFCSPAQQIHRKGKQTYKCSSKMVCNLMVSLFTVLSLKPCQSCMQSQHLPGLLRNSNYSQHKFCCQVLWNFVEKDKNNKYTNKFVASKQVKILKS